MLLIFRALRPLAASVFSIAGGVVFAFFLCHALWNSIHILTLLFGASLIGVAVDYSLHLYYFRSSYPAGAADSKTHFIPRCCSVCLPVLSVTVLWPCRALKLCSRWRCFPSPV